MPHRLESPRAMALCVGMLVIALASHHRLSAADPNVDGQFFVLLRNGEVLRGSLERDGDHYLVRRSGNAELRIPYKDISHVAPRMQSLYQHRANRIIEFQADEHLDLASWCLQNGLEPQATHHILRAETIDPFHPHLSLLKARLEGFLSNDRRSDSPANEIALMAAVGDEPIPITAAPIDDESRILEELPPRNEQSQLAVETPTIPSAPQPIDITIDAPELIPEDVVGTPINAIELPELFPSLSGPPVFPERNVNEDLIRQVEATLAKIPSSEIEAELPKPNEPIRRRIAQNAGPLDPDLARADELPPNESNVENESAIQDQTPIYSESLHGNGPLVENEDSADRQQPRQESAVPDVKLPPELIRQYVANIQPMLLTRCGAANCHGHSSEAKFKLHRVSDRRPSRAMTLQNLAATLEQLDEQNPTDSPLFTWGQTAHGKTQSKLFAITNVQQQTMLLNWIQDVSAPPTEPKQTDQDTFVDRRSAFADGAERISLRKIKETDIRWREPTQRAVERLRVAEPAHRQSTHIDFSPRRETERR